MLTAFGQPKIEFKNSVFDFGTTPYPNPPYDSAFKKADFVFYNKGTQPLTIYSIRCSFDFCESHTTKNTIPPNDSAKIILRCEFLRIGKFQKSCVVYSNDTSHASHTITIRGETLSPDTLMQYKWNIYWGDLWFNNGHPYFDKAKKYYEDALLFKPNEQYPKDQIQKCWEFGKW